MKYQLWANPNSKAMLLTQMKRHIWVVHLKFSALCLKEYIICCWIIIVVPYYPSLYLILIHRLTNQEPLVQVVQFRQWQGSWCQNNLPQKTSQTLDKLFLKTKQLLESIRWGEGGTEAETEEGNCTEGYSYLMAFPLKKTHR